MFQIKVLSKFIHHKARTDLVPNSRQVTFGTQSSFDDYWCDLYILTKLSNYGIFHQLQIWQSTQVPKTQKRGTLM